MAGSNFARGRYGGFYTAVPDAEIARRIELIRAAKADVARDLTDAELDELLDPVPCLRTRTRLAKQQSQNNDERMQR